MSIHQIISKSARRPLARTVALALVVGGLVSAGTFTPAVAASGKNAAAVSTQQALPMSFADVVERVSPAVVNIQVTSRAKPSLTRMEGVPGNMQEFFRHHFGPQGNENRRAPARVGAGSGFVIDADGHIVTNEHVVRGAEEITVTFQDGKTATARLIGQDPKTDLAVLKIDLDEPVPFVSFGNSDKVRVGDWVVTVGNPFGLGHSVNVGIVSARGRTIGAGPYDDFLQIDAAINRGNSGGPAFDIHGNVVGVNAAIYSPNGGNVGIGFAIPAALAENVIEDLKSNGVVERGWLGVSIQAVNDDIAESLGVEPGTGVLVSDVRADSPARAAGLRTGDLIVDVDGKAIDKTHRLPRVIADIDPGTDSKITVMRNGERQSITVQIGRQPSAQVAANDDGAVDTETNLGLAVQSLTPEIARELSIPDGTGGVVVADVEPGSPAAEKGLRRGDVVLSVNGRAVATPGDVVDAIKDARDNGKKSLLTLVFRSGAQRFVALPLRAA